MPRLIFLLFLTALILLNSSPSPAAETGPAPRQPTVIQQYHGDSMFELYRRNAEEGIGNHITRDFVLLAYSLFLDDLTTQLEERVICPAFTDLAQRMLAILKETDPTVPGAKTATAYASVLLRTLKPSSVVPEDVLPTVEAELALIEKHEGLSRSAVFDVREDFSQYVPRGKYSSSELLSNYFQAMTYAGRMGFYLKESSAMGVSAELADEHTAAALLLTRILRRDTSLNDLFKSVEALLTLIAGPSDDLGPDDYAHAVGLPAHEARRKILDEAKASNRLPSIVSIAMDGRSLKEGERPGEASAGFRLFGQRYTVESHVFRKLTYDQVTDYNGSLNSIPFTLSTINGKRVRGFPTVLDIMAGLDCPLAGSLLARAGDADYTGYGERFEEAASLLLDRAAKPRSILESNLGIVHAVLKEIDKHVSPSDQAAALNAALGFWIRSRHGNALYAKQSYTTGSKSIGSLGAARRTATLEGGPLFYKFLMDSLDRTSSKLLESSRGIPKIEQALNDSNIAGNILRFREVMERLSDMTTRRAHKRLSREDCRFLNNLDTELAALLPDTDHPVVVDVHTEPNSGMVLEEALGYPLAVTNGKPAKQYHRGARFNCYEIKQPLDRRLTDEEWQSMLQAGLREPSLSARIPGLNRESETDQGIQGSKGVRK